MKRTRRRPPYKPNGRTTFNNPVDAGVYLIFEPGSVKAVYIGYGNKVYKALYRHFQSWDDPKQVRVTYPKGDGYTVRVVYTRTAAQAERLERALIIKHRPADNPNKLKNYELDPAMERVIDAAENAPWMPSNDEAPF